MIGGLFIRSYERAERVYAAMQSRGYDGSIRFAEERTLSSVDWTALVVALTTIAGLGAYARL
jgi:energy-coupling factor transporter transmembrane protein EcfT